MASLAPTQPPTATGPASSSGSSGSCGLTRRPSASGSVCSGSASAWNAPPAAVGQLVGDVQVAVLGQADRGEQVLRLVGGGPGPWVAGPDPAAAARNDQHADHEQADDAAASSHGRATGRGRTDAEPARRQSKRIGAADHQEPGQHTRTGRPGQSEARPASARKASSVGAPDRGWPGSRSPGGASSSVAGSSFMVDSSTRPAPASEAGAASGAARRCAGGGARPAPSMRAASSRREGHRGRRPPGRPAWPGRRSGRRRRRPARASVW